MGLTPRALGIRVVIWTALFFWAVWKIRTSADVAEGAAMAVAPAVRELSGGPAEIVGEDPAMVLASLAAVKAAPCSAWGAELTVRVQLGLQRATLNGQVPDAVAACIAEAVWAQPWPSLPIEMQSSVAW